MSAFGIENLVCDMGEACTCTEPEEAWICRYTHFPGKDSHGRDVAQRDPRERDPKYLGWVATLPCIACMVGGIVKRGVQVAHLRASSLEYGKRETGKGEKPHDVWTTPLCPEHHVNGNRSQHHVGEEAFWMGLGINPFAFCLALREAYEAGKPGYAVIARTAGRALAMRAH